MRFVDRASVAAPASLAEGAGPGHDELVAARTYYEGIPAPKTCYPFEAYKAEDVKLALRNLFHGKCAYCESAIEATQPTDVEHYRPKGGVQDRKAHPGYWWLAMRWSNLLPSCIDCNRRRGQVTAELGMTLSQLEAAIRAQGNKKPRGKKNAFPTLDSVWVDPEIDPEPVEKPSLIDPTRTDPAGHLVWAGDEVPVVIPAVDDAGVECPRAVASIHIYALNRLGLVQKRAEVIRDVEAHLKTIRDMRDLALGLDGEARAAALDKVDAAIERVKERADGKLTYSALVEARLKDFEAELVQMLDEP